MQLNKEEKKRLEKELEKWNANSKHYVSIEAIEDAMNWTPDYISPEDFKEIFGSQSCTTVI
jgi:hypothetical protein